MEDEPWSDQCFFFSPGLLSSGLQDVHVCEGLWGAAVLHPEEAVSAEWPPLWGPPLPCHWWLTLLPGQQDRTCHLEETSGRLLSFLKEFHIKLSETSAHLSVYNIYHTAKYQTVKYKNLGNTEVEILIKLLVQWLEFILLRIKNNKNKRLTSFTDG